MSGKICTKCGVSKDTSDFGRNTSRPDGLQGHCQGCRKAARAALKARNLQVPPPVGGKTCSFCQVRQDASCFSRKRHSADGLDSTCRGCASFKKWQRSPEARKKQVESTRTWKIENRDRSLANDRAYSARNPDKRNARAAKRRSAKMQRTPAWLTEKDFQIMRDIYFYAKLITEATGVAHHVDHIFPLQGDTVSGLHVPENLQVLPALENLRKFNKHEVYLDF